MDDESVPDGGEEQDEGQDGDPQLFVSLRTQVSVIGDEGLERRVHLLFSLTTSFYNNKKDLLCSLRGECPCITGTSIRIYYVSTSVIGDC